MAMTRVVAGGHEGDGGHGGFGVRMRWGGDLESEGESDEGGRGQVGEWGGSSRHSGWPYPLAGDVAVRGGAPGQMGTRLGRRSSEEGIRPCGERWPAYWGGLKPSGQGGLLSSPFSPSLLFLINRDG